MTTPTHAIPTQLRSPTRAILFPLILLLTLSLTISRGQAQVQNAFKFIPFSKIGQYCMVPTMIYITSLQFPNPFPFLEKLYTKETLTPEERESIEKYTYLHSGVINRHLRGLKQIEEGENKCPQPSPIEVDKVVDDLSKALEKFYPYKGLVYRGLKSARTQKQKEYYEYLMNLPEGEVIQEDGFLSTSRWKWVGNHHLGYDDGIQMVIESKTGRKIYFASRFPWEREILFPRKTKFVLKKKDSEKRILYFQEYTGEGQNQSEGSKALSRFSAGFNSPSFIEGGQHYQKCFRKFYKPF